MYGFNVALVSVSGWRNTHMLAFTQDHGKVTFEFAAAVSLQDQFMQRDTVTIQLPLDAGSKDGAGSGTALLGKRPEQQTAANIAGGVLDDG